MSCTQWPAYSACTNACPGWIETPTGKIEACIDCKRFVFDGTECLDDHSAAMHARECECGALRGDRYAACESCDEIRRCSHPAGDLNGAWVCSECAEDAPKLSECGHSACVQHFIDTGDTSCVQDD